MYRAQIALFFRLCVMMWKTLSLMWLTIWLKIWMRLPLMCLMLLKMLKKMGC